MRPKRLHILGKAGTAVADAGIDEGIADARIRTNPQAHGLDIGADPLSDIGDFVHEADLGGQHRVGRVLGQLRRALIHQHDALVVAIERRVQGFQCRHGLGTAAADDNPVRASCSP